VNHIIWIINTSYGSQIHHMDHKTHHKLIIYDVSGAANGLAQAVSGPTRALGPLLGVYCDVFDVFMIHMMYFMIHMMYFMIHMMSL